MRSSRSKAGIACISFTGLSLANGNCSVRTNSGRRRPLFRRSCRKSAPFLSTQLLTLSIVTPKADLGFMLITPDLHAANRIEKQLGFSLGADVLLPVYSYLSLTEESEYATSEEDHARTLETEQKLKPGSPEFDASDGCFPRSDGKIPPRPCLSYAARLAGRLLL